MKKILVVIVFAMLGVAVYSQENFKWDINDSIPKSKEKIYNETKLFIADTWKSSKDVVQIDDKENGIIVIRGGIEVTKEIQFLLSPTWYYLYTVKFYQKENRFRISLSDVFCETASAGHYAWPLMPVSDFYPEKDGRTITGISKKQYLSLMVYLKSKLQDTINDYISFIKKDNKKDTNDW